ncbi:hypothetical protein ACCO45_011064 [Purpureocillium lilacinum]|uniref:Uncharacterized protein n=1 Tax=Purpureocillium lilacinum TaxID=33203 RepID=A0ACC4DGJ6_PURLI
MDLVNFSDTLLPFSGSELHDIASHELGYHRNAFDDAGMKASAELSGMLKDEGLYLDGPASFIAHSKHLQPLSGQRWCARVIRAWKGNPVGSDYDDEDEGHPTSTRDEDTVIWKKVPTSRDGHKRIWIQFSRFSGYEINDLDADSSSFLEYMMADDVD